MFEDVHANESALALGGCGPVLFLASAIESQESSRRMKFFPTLSWLHGSRQKMLLQVQVHCKVAGNAGEGHLTQSVTGHVTWLTYLDSLSFSFVICEMGP